MLLTCCLLLVMFGLLVIWVCADDVWVWLGCLSLVGLFWFYCFNWLLLLGLLGCLGCCLLVGGFVVCGCWFWVFVYVFGVLLLFRCCLLICIDWCWFTFDGFAGFLMNWCLMFGLVVLGLIDLVVFNLVVLLTCCWLL